MEISKGKVGEIYLVGEIDLDTAEKRRLEILGVTINSKIEILNSKPSGSKIIKVRGTRLAVGERFAKGIKGERISVAAQKRQEVVEI